MFEIRRAVLRGSVFTAALALAGGAFAGCSGDKGDKGDKGDPGDPGTNAPGPGSDEAAALKTATPIKHVVIIFGENVSFDHYFGTYPTAKPVASATNDLPTHGAPFTALVGTPKANNLVTPLNVNSGNFEALTIDLMASNPNGVAPFRLAPGQASTDDQNHAYTPEQAAANTGLMNSFPTKVGNGSKANPLAVSGAADNDGTLVMGYYDGNTVTALWNYAQHFAMNDNSWTTQFGPSTPGAINLISGQTNGVLDQTQTVPSSNLVDDGHGNFTLVGDTDPLNDICSDPGRQQNLMASKNIGDLLNTANITWGSFMGGFDLTITNPNGSFGCGRMSVPTQVPFSGNPSADYIPHHAWFQYYASTQNATHARPSSVAAIGHSKQADGSAEPANHNYDSHDFFDALAAGNLPAVSFLKAPAYQDGHGGYSNPIDEQMFIVSVVNALQSSSFWGSTAVILAYDDSDGWYDHQAPPIVNASAVSQIGTTTVTTNVADVLNGADGCLHTNDQQGKTAAVLKGFGGMPVLGRCGYGTRIPLLVVSPYAKKNFIDHTLTDQSSVLRFIEDNWLGGQRIQDGGSFDTIAGPINGMFQFPAAAATATAMTDARKLMLDPDTGHPLDE